MPAPLETCVLGSAQAEQDWIAQRIQLGIARPQLAFVDYAQAAVIYGRSTVPSPEAIARAREKSAAVVQRRTGGGAVLAGPWMLGAALLLPPGSAFGRGGIVTAFREFGAVWRAVLQGMGVACEAATPQQMEQHNELAAQAGVKWVCFSGLSHGELVDAQGSKLVGLAQARGKWGTLLSAGVLLQPVPWALLGWVHLAQPDWRYALPSTRGAPVSPRALRAGLGQALGEAFDAQA